MIESHRRYSFAALVIYALSILIVRALCAIGFRAKIRRSRHFPGHPCVLACNHRSFADPPLVAVWCGGTPIGFFARSNLWKLPFIGHCLRMFRGIPVDRDNPSISSMKGAVETLRSGVSVLVFPEGTRTRTGRLGTLRDGPALFARRAGVPLVPVYLHRSESVWPRGSPIYMLWGRRIEIRFGRPIVPPKGLDARTSDQWVTTRLSAWMHRQERELNRD